MNGGTGGVEMGRDGPGDTEDSDAGAASDDAGQTGDTPGPDGALAQPDTGGQSATDAPVAGDAAVAQDAPALVDAPPVMDAPADTSLPRMAECSFPSIDRLAHWYVASDAKAVTVPAAGSILVPEGDHQVGKVSFVGAGWHVVAVWIANSVTSQADLSASGGFTVTYSATDDLWVQLREVANYGAGGHFVTVLPSTGGQQQTLFVPFSADQWSVLPTLGMPTVPFAQAITQVRGLFFIDNAANTLEFDRLVIDSFVPECR